MSNISYKLGMLLGPLLSGGLTDAVGYYYMNMFFCMSSYFGYIVLTVQQSYVSLWALLRSLPSRLSDCCRLLYSKPPKIVKVNIGNTFR